MARVLPQEEVPYTSFFFNGHTTLIPFGICYLSHSMFNMDFYIALCRGSVDDNAIPFCTAVMLLSRFASSPSRETFLHHHIFGFSADPFVIFDRNLLITRVKQEHTPSRCAFSTFYAFLSIKA
jgi:hypothetical protein